LRQGR